jgi:hypothetical protein
MNEVLIMMNLSKSIYPSSIVGLTKIKKINEWIVILIVIEFK